MFDIVFPNSNEQEFITMAEKLGINELCLTYDSPKDISGWQSKTSIKLFSGILVKPGSEQKFVGKADILIAKTSDPNTMRLLAETGHINIIYDLEQAERPDFIHHRNSGLNHIICKMIAEKNISIYFNFSSILDSSGKTRAIILGRMKQNLRFAKKYDIQFSASSFAAHPFDMRSDLVRNSFLNTITNNN